MSDRLPNHLYLVRHGRYDRETQSLTDEGREIDAVNARDDLLAEGLGSSALVLTSTAPRAQETAAIIAEGLGTRSVASRLLEEGGNRAYGVRNLDELILRAANLAGVTVPDTAPTVVVTHAPMVAIAHRWYGPDDVEQVGYGSVVEYDPGTWMNPVFIESYEV